MYVDRWMDRNTLVVTKVGHGSTFYDPTLRNPSTHRRFKKIGPNPTQRNQIFRYFEFR